MAVKTLSSGVVVVRKVGNEYVYLLLRAYQHWDFPKGVVEKGETPMEGARREVREETTITELDFRWSDAFFETGPYGRGKVARYYLAETHQEQIELLVNPEIGRAEHEEYCWVSYEQAKNMVSARVRTVLEWANDRLKYS